MSKPEEDPMQEKNKFRFVMPADLEKAQDGSWKVRGLASTDKIDQQGERIVQKGMDLTPIDKKKGILNWDHQKGPENTIGLLDGYKRGGTGLYVEGRLFKNHTKAKAVKEIMDSLGEGDRGRIGLSVEGQIIERDDSNPKIIKKCKINAVALTMNPVNTETYADLVKSMSGGEVEFDSTEEHITEEHQGEPTFTAGQVMVMIQKALGVGAGYTQAPSDLSGGDALAQQHMAGKKKKKPKKMKKMQKSLYKAHLQDIMKKLSILYPDVEKMDLLIAVQDRLQTKYPDIKESFGKAGFRLKQMDPKEKEHKLYEEARQRSDYEENKDKTRSQLAQIARESGAPKKEQAKIRAQRDAAKQAGEDRDHVRPGVGR